MMKLDNYIKIDFPSHSANEAFARNATAVFAAQLDPTLDEIGDIKTAVSEAVTNCIIHAYPDEIGKIQLRCRIINGDMLEISVRDWGIGIENVDKAMEPMFTTGGEERSGMGFSVMDGFMDSMKVRSSPDKGTVITLKKRIKSKHRR